jgi:hypothetical protein
MYNYTNAGLIAGGIKVTHDTITGGKQEYVVGENSKWYMRDKLLQYEYLKDSDDDKRMLKILNIAVPISFNRKVYYDDSQDRPAPDTEDYHRKASSVLDDRFKESISAMVKRLIDEYALRTPLIFMLSHIIKYLVVKEKQQNPNDGKIKIAPNMSKVIEALWKEQHYFEYIVNDKDVPTNLIDLMLHLLDLMKSKKTGTWATPQLTDATYPQLSDDVEKKIKELMSDPPLDIHGKVYTLLMVEMELNDHMDSIEKYFITVAKNFGIILESLRIYIRSLSSS